MDKICFALLLLALLTACAGSPAKPTPHTITTGEGQRWSIVWSDEFDYTGKPDPRRWDYEIGFIRNSEVQEYTDALENARVEDGNLIIESHKTGEYQYTSASVISKGRGEWTYGRIEVRAKIPTGIGMWPAIWMLGVNIDEVGWPTCGEIDIMENVGYSPHQIHGTVHTEAYNHVQGTSQGSTIYLYEPYADFHVYAVEWFEDHIDFFVDDEQYFTFENDGTGNAAWPFDKPHYLILNAAVGGSWGGQFGVDDDIFPQQYLIDYVRVYEAVE